MLILRALTVGSVILAAYCTAATAAGVKDPLSSVRALYSPERGTETARAGVSQIYELGSRSLRLRLMGSGVCTFPMRSRDITCSEIVDPRIKGAVSRMPQPVFGQVTPDKQTRIVTVTIADGSGPQIFNYLFAQTGGSWELENVEATGTSKWSLSALTGAGRPDDTFPRRDTPKP